VIARSVTCHKCYNDIHVYLNCSYYDQKSYTECAEPSAERVVDKEKANFCDYFKLSEKTDQAVDTKADTLKQLNDLFK